MTGMANTYQAQGANAGAQFDRFDPRYERAVNDQVAGLQEDPYAGAYGAARVAQATQGVNQDYDAAQASALARIKNRGVAGSASDVGAISTLEAGRAGTFAGARNNMAMDSIQNRQSRLAQIAQVLGGARGQALNERGVAQGNQQNTEQSILNLLMNRSQAFGQQQESDRAAYGAGVGNLASAGGTLLGMGQGGDLEALIKRMLAQGVK